jgi:hypothetical protein
LNNININVSSSPSSSSSSAKILKSKQQLRRKTLILTLYSSIREQLNVLESGLSVHGRILKEVETKYCLNFNILINNNINEDEDNNAPISASLNNDSNYEHIKHMNQLNKHLIGCLKKIENELNERWAKF